MTTQTRDELKEKLLAKMPEHLFKFLDTLTGNELNKLKEADLQLISRVYQAGATFAIESTIEILKESK